MFSHLPHANIINLVVSFLTWKLLISFFPQNFLILLCWIQKAFFRKMYISIYIDVPYVLCCIMKICIEMYGYHDSWEMSTCSRKVEVSLIFLLHENCWEYKIWQNLFRKKDPVNINLEYKIWYFFIAIQNGRYNLMHLACCIS